MKGYETWTAPFTKAVPPASAVGRRRGQAVLPTLATLASVLSPLKGTAQGPPLRYNIFDLGTLGGPSSVALAVNEQGQVVGGADTREGDRHAFVWQGGVMRDLGVLPGDTISEANDLNNSGQIVGHSTPGVFCCNHAVLWENGQIIDLGGLGPQGGTNLAHGINESGQIVGIAQAGINGHAFLWQDWVMSDLGTLGGTYSLAWDINAAGDVVGVAWATSEERAFLWRNGVMTDLGTLGGAGSAAFGINDLGQVVGWAQHTPGNKFHHPFVWQNGVMTDLTTAAGFPEGRAWAVDGSGRVLHFEAFLYDPNHGVFQLQDLIPPDSGWLIVNSRGLNSAGWIVGYGIHQGAPRGYVMIPAPPPPPIPTVSGWGGLVLASLLVAASGIVMRGRRQFFSACH